MPLRQATGNKPKKMSKHHEIPAEDNTVLPWNALMEMEMEMEIENENEDDEKVRNSPQHFESVVAEERQRPPPPCPPSPSALKSTRSIGPDDSPTASKQRQQRISFGQVHVVRFWPQLGDHPAVSSGCPIALGDPIIFSPEIFDMDLYEETRHSKRRSFHQLRIPAEERARILLTMGHSRGEIVGKARDIHLLRESRRRTSRQTQQLDAYYGYYGALARRMGNHHHRDHVQTTVV